jgi:outer membrane lipoprotein LolB
MRPVVRALSSCALVSRGLIGALAVFSLASCVGPVAITPAADPAAIEAREARLQRFESWRSQGSLALDSEEQGVFNVTFAWDANPDGFDIRLFGPLGKQVYRVSQDIYGATLWRDSDPPVYGASADELLLLASGIAIPVEQMRYWAVGLPGDTAQDDIRRDGSGRLRALQVRDADSMAWQLEFLRYRTVNAMDLPREIHVSGDGVEIELTIRKWSLPGNVVDDSGRLRIPGIDD